MAVVALFAALLLQRYIAILQEDANDANDAKTVLQQTADLPWGHQQTTVCASLHHGRCNKIVAVLGLGKFGKALVTRLADATYPVVVGTRNPEAERVTAFIQNETARASPMTGPMVAMTYADAVEAADIVFVALPSFSTDEEASRLADTIGLTRAAGKIVVDATNPLEREGGFENGTWRLVYGSSAEPWSGGEALQRVMPESRIVKAFNVIWDRIMLDPSVVGFGRHTIWIAGNDEAAKRVVAEIICRMYYEPVDVGRIERSRNLEMMLDLWLAMFEPGGPIFAFDLVMRPVRTESPSCLSEETTTVFTDHFAPHGFDEREFGLLACIMDVGDTASLVSEAQDRTLRAILEEIWGSSEKAHELDTILQGTLIPVTREGRKVDKLLILLSGSCQVSTCAHGEINTVGPGALIGENTLERLDEVENFANATVACTRDSVFASWFERPLQLHLAKRPVERIKFLRLLRSKRHH